MTTLLKSWALIALALVVVVLASVQEVRAEEGDWIPSNMGSGEEAATQGGGADGGGEKDPLENMSAEEIEEMMKKLDRDSAGAMGGFGGLTGGSTRRYTRDIPAVEEDIPHVQCETCLELVKEVQKRIAERKSKLKKKKVTELEILEMLETICDPLQGDGEWLTFLDIVEKDDKLTIENKGQQGYCEEECKTIMQACDNVVKEADSGIAELLYSNKPGVEQKICGSLIKGLKGACGQPFPPIRPNRVVGGDNFRPKSDLDIALAEAGKELRKKQEINPDFLRDDL